MTQDQLVQQHFDDVARDGSYLAFYRGGDTLENHDFVARVQRIEDLLAPHVRQGMAVLDLGCGPGPLVPYFCSRGARFCGVDVAPSMLESLHRQFDGSDHADLIETKLGSCEDIPYPDATFDVVVAMGLVEYLADLEPTLRELDRVVKPGGLVVITVPNRHCLNRTVIRHSGFVTSAYRAFGRLLGREPVPGSPIVHREFGPAALDRLMADRAYTKVGQAFYDYKLLCYPITRVVPRFAFAVNRRLEARGPGWLANGYIGVYRRAGERSVG